MSNVHTITVTDLLISFEAASKGPWTHILGCVSEPHFKTLLHLTLPNLEVDTYLYYLRQGWFLFQGTMIVKGREGTPHNRIYWWRDVRRLELFTYELPAEPEDEYE